MDDARPSPELDELIATVTGQVERLTLDRFDHDDAWLLGTSLVELARSRGLPVVVDVRRPDHVLFHASLAGTVPDNDTWVERKSRATLRFGAPSFLLGLRARARGTTFAAQTGLPEQEYAAHGGSFPLVVRHVGVIGAVTVSGLPQADDHALVVEALEAFVAGRRP
ncbi:heme-degrading domain-containing protein [Cellulomonas sp. APG4]|uniref:heme-degrading domain-containing protein n=1 Tax=Cellulomonas sp. APG4 TaxID=1538656 RepID=UPI001379AF00|nr:heme-degrading domain-containing protein [Cellulomonas sp. APG4]NCT90730.1 heme-degrading domain-containing protein [Cellulomonas sp. APG4]